MVNEFIQERQIIFVKAAEEYKEILSLQNIFISSSEALEQAIDLLNLFGALTVDRKEREDETQ